jgi:DNA-binding transcriptional ArsR family regulator
VTPREATLHRTALLESALHYARQGWPVFPLHSIHGGHCSCGKDCGRDAGKHPRWRAGDLEHGLLDGSTDEAKIRDWWATWPDANVGIRTGAESGLVVVDLDPKPGAEEQWAALVAGHEPMPATPESITGGGGRHLLFAHPGGYVKSRDAALGFPGVDCKADGGYIVAPPSTHRSGRCYEWELSAHPDDVPLAPAPAWFLALLTRSEGREETNGSGPRAAEDWAALLQGTPEGERHAVLCRIAGHYLGLGIPADEVEEICLGVAARCRPPHDPADVRTVVRDFAAKDAARATAEPTEPGAGWPLHDGSEPWEFPAIAELIDSFLPTAGVVWWGGLPKRFKSLLMLYVCLAIACRRSAVARKFLVKAFPRILYVAREDGGARLQERRDDILSAWTERPEPGAIVFVIRPALNLLNPEHVAWLRDTCLRLGITMLVLDTWTALSPSADPLGAKDQAALAAVVVKLCEDIGGLVVVVDHSRKNRPEGQSLSSADIFGPPQKWAAAEHIVMLDVVEAGARLEVFIEGKDLETRRFFLAVSPKGSGEEKFTYAGSAEELADARRAVGDQNRQAVLETLRANPAGLSTGELVAALKAAGTTLSQDTVARHCQALVKDKLARRVTLGQGRSHARFVAVDDHPHEPSTDAAESEA